MGVGKDVLWMWVFSIINGAVSWLWLPCFKETLCLPFLGVNAIRALLDEIDSDENILGESWGLQQQEEFENCSPNSDPLWELIGLISNGITD